MRSDFAEEACNCTTQSYDAAGRVVTITDAAGNRTGITDARGNRITFTYDSRGSQTELVDQLQRRTTFGYDAVRRPSWRLDAKGQLVTSVYDAASRLLQRQYSDGSIATFTYDSVGSRLTMEDGTEGWHGRGLSRMSHASTLPLPSRAYHYPHRAQEGHQHGRERAYLAIWSAAAQPPL